MRKHYEEVKEYILENLNDEGLFSKRYSDIQNDLGIHQNLVRGIILQIVKEGLLVVENPPQKGRSSNPRWRVKTKLSNAILQRNSDNDIIEIEFGGITLHILQTEIGGCISKEELATATLEREDLIDKIIKANKEQFSTNMIIIDGKVYLNRISVMNYLMKLNTSNVLNVKKQVLIDLQNSVLDKMCSGILEGKIILTENERIKIRHNLSCLTDIKKEDIEKLFQNLEEQIENLVSGVSTLATKQKIEINKLEKEVKHLTSRVETEKVAKERLMTQSNELKAKLLERN